MEILLSLRADSSEPGAFVIKRGSVDIGRLFTGRLSREYAFECRPGVILFQTELIAISDFIQGITRGA